MARDEQHLFDFRRLHISFAALSALVLVSLIAFVRADNDREWKKWQRGFYDLSHRAAIERLAELRAVNEAGEEDSIEGFRRQRDLAVIDGRRRALELDIENSRSRREILRQRLEIGGYEATEELHALDAMVLELTRDLERLDSRRRDFLPPRQEAGRDAVDAEILRLKRQATETRPSRLSFMREAPILDVFTGRLRIRSISVKDFPVPNRFARVPREDRCITCHMGIDTPGYEAEPNPYKTHPRLDLFVSDGSPHPSSAFGCTFCHGGGGDSLTFVGSGHMPGSEEQAEAWRTLYRWTAPGGTQQAMTQAAFAESACNICHIEDVRLDYAPRLTRGRAIFERAGCIGCHPVSGLSPPWKPGSDLRLVASKVSEPWIRKWIASPRAFRKNTSMPEIFPDGGPQIRRRQEAEIASIAAYLTATSPKSPPLPAASMGSAQEGVLLFRSIGCIGCHTHDTLPEPAAAGLRESRPLGPDLSGLASKLELGWLISWLKDPRGISPTTRMPDFRLRGEESGHLAAFLLDERNSGFEEKDAPSVSLEDLREAARDAAATRLSIDEAQEAISRLSSGDLALIAGEATIRRYGCGGCHAIAGFEDTPPIGPDLTAVASKPLQQFDFGLLDVRRTLSDWLRVKLSDPRAFDRGRIKRPNERLRMGNFDLDPAEIDYLLTFLLGLRDVSPPEHRRPRPDTLRSALRQGRSLSAEFGCTACHETESAESEIGPFFSDPALAPPGLKGQGRRVRAEWLAAYLRDPSLVIRPWLNVRMPSYDWDEETVQDWVRYLRAADGLEMAIEPPAVSVLSKAAAAAGRSVFVELECRNCHDGPPYRSLFDRLRAAPPYPLARERLRPEWVRHFLADPQAVLPGTRMPSFFYVAGRPITPDAESRIEALTAFLFLQD